MALSSHSFSMLSRRDFAFHDDSFYVQDGIIWRRSAWLRGNSREVFFKACIWMKHTWVPLSISRRGSVYFSWIPMKPKPIQTKFWCKTFLLISIDNCGDKIRNGKNFFMWFFSFHFLVFVHVSFFLCLVFVFCVTHGIIHWFFHFFENVHFFHGSVVAGSCFAFIFGFISFVNVRHVESCAHELVFFPFYFPWNCLCERLLFMGVNGGKWGQMGVNGGKMEFLKIGRFLWK